MRKGGIGRHDAEGAVAMLRQAPQNSINIHLLLMEVVKEFGGNQGLAQKLAHTYEELPAKSPARERMLTNIMRLIATASAPATGTVSATEEQIEEELRNVVEGICADGD